jgi:hypothetical protein
MVKLGFIGERGERPGELLARSSPEPPQETSKNILVKTIVKYIFFKFFEVQKLFYKKVSGGVQG